MITLSERPNHLHDHPHDAQVRERKQTPEGWRRVYFVLDEYLVTALVPSETACFASSPGRISRTEVWISREEMVDFLLYAASLDASVATRSKISAGGCQNWSGCEDHG